jgi:hypothetical protein
LEFFTVSCIRVSAAAPATPPSRAYKAFIV